MSILKTIVLPLAWSFILLCSATILSGQTTPPQEYHIKAVFLYNFTQFVEWPTQSLSVEKAPVVIGVLGENPFGTYLGEVVAGEEVNGHPLVVQYFNNIDEVETCHILFINVIKNGQLKEAIDKLKGRSILTVSDENDFMQQGGMVRFTTVNKKIRFQINPEAAKAAGLRISSKLLRLAEIVTLQ